jgi:hypothetical protein
MAAACALAGGMLGTCAAYVHVREVVAAARSFLTQLLAWITPGREWAPALCFNNYNLKQLMLPSYLQSCRAEA